MISGEHSAAAQKVYETDPEWTAPMLWRSEMRNVLTLYLRRNEMTLADAYTAMDKAARAINGREYEVDSNLVLQLSAESGCTAYDCEFVYLAERLTISLVTSDKKVLAAFSKIALLMDSFAAQNSGRSGLNP